MRQDMRDGRIPQAWRIDMPSRSVERWEPFEVDRPIEILRASDEFGFAGVKFTVDGTFAIFDPA